MMDLRIESESRQCVLVLSPKVPRLDAAVAAEFRRQALERIPGHAHVVLLLGEVSFVDSTGLGTIVALLKALPPAGSVRLVGVHKSVSALLRLTRLDKVFRAFDDVETALAA